MTFFNNLGLRIRNALGKKPNPAVPPTGNRIPDDRPLTTEERTLIVWLLEHGIPAAQAYASQLEQVRVVSRCGCGCPTVDLAVSDTQASPRSPSLLLADFQGMTPEGHRVGVILHGREGKISELEIYPIDPISGTFRHPKIETLN